MSFRPLLALLSIPLLAVAFSPGAFAAPTCGTLAGVRCADNGAFCWVYLNAGVHECVQTSASATSVGHCFDTDHTNCPGLVCVWDGTLVVCVPSSLTAPSVGVCTEFQGDCPYEQLACGIVGAKYVCVEDPCYKDPELCHPTLA